MTRQPCTSTTKLIAATKATADAAQGFAPSMLIPILLLLLGGAFLYFGAEWLVSGASRLALSLGVSELLVGLTVVAYATSAPEAVVTVQASLGGSSAIALGNIIGSNIANIGLILGAAALIRPALVERSLGRRDIPALLLATLLLPVALWDGSIVTWEGLVLLLCAAAYSAFAVVSAKRQSKTVAPPTVHLVDQLEDVPGAAKPTSRLWMVITAAAGLALLVLGGDLFVRGASELALAFGMSERLVGLTIVAVGTSLPELATSVIAALRGNSDIAVGNVVGSNIFNILMCLGLAGTIGTIAAPLSTLWVDLSVMGAFTLAGAWMMRTERRVTRLEGALLIAGYAGFLAFMALARG